MSYSEESSMLESECEPVYVRQKMQNGHFSIAKTKFYPCCLAEVDEEHLLVVDWKKSNLMLVNKAFEEVKRINLGLYQQAYGCAVNKHKDVFILNKNFIAKFDADLKSQRKRFELKDPAGIACSAESVYVGCQSSKKLIKLSFELEFEAEFQLEDKPCRIYILNGVACIKYPNEQIVFYELNSMAKLRSYKRTQHIMGTINSNFYEYSKQGKFRCYENGELVYEVDAEVARPNFAMNDLSGFLFLNGKIVFYTEFHTELYFF